ncbi:histidine kinase [Sphaerisporangium sp. TRM90804]|uniref:sensor histidine kinase n=1 Tax=Sphaerisporangium sp. TRM90804 TaxID=3031113 RepID=UPI00244C8A58|nr:histidine kinase [Sphaerisporangium sp. TRM90804]MDH2428781.1 histidine kinase [Sphaerisporangium sp. TRM90804]
MREPEFVSWVERISEVVLVGVLGLLLLADTARGLSLGGADLAVPLCGLVGTGAYVLRRRHRVGGAVLLISLSAAISLSVGRHGLGSGFPGFAEAGSLLLITIGVLRWVAPLRRAVWITSAVMVVLELAAVLRAEGEGDAVSFGFLFFVAWATAVGIGSYLRYQLQRRRQTVEAVRRAERLELARELHDLVAHHITGIVVQAQAARTVADQHPEAVTTSLDAIAGAGAEALTSMRRLVGVLRSEDDASRRPGSSLTDLRVLVEKFSVDGPPVAYEVGQGVSDSALPPEVVTTLHRVLLESLTNLRRHAPGARWAQVDLRTADQGVLLRIRNPHSIADPRVSALGGGYGLVGMAERVTALGGDLRAGPTPEGAWEVRAWFPAG